MKIRNIIYTGIILGLVKISQAAIPAPDNVLYGTISLDGIPVTASNTSVVIEARRVPGGKVVSTYRMGDDPNAGDCYLLELTLEEMGPSVETNASLVGDVFLVTLMDDTNTIYQANFTIPERGHIERIDLGLLTDDDGNGIPDAWEVHYFGANGQDPDSDGDADGICLKDEYIMGINPTNASGFAAGDRPFLLDIDVYRTVSFYGQKAEGYGYEGLQRKYALEGTKSLTAPGWFDVHGPPYITGENKMVNNAIFIPPHLHQAPYYFRGRVWLEPQ